ncbi:hypothetical protein GCM10027176_85670 [Actinoallomurus bryophytorum]|uniref:Uncharacterized protein n=2 Tax=Actinoallomurus bryophytorum TaxID=1490222 RepID=A0A543CSU9_9ACTN|nr:hypothetical protein FB559_5889 [Actinoallomurus bryophytorum]
MSEPQQYGAVPPQPGPAFTPPPPQKRRGRRIIALVVLALIVVGIVVAALASSGSNPDSAAVNDCVTKPNNDSIKVVGCTSGDAALKVVGKVENKTQADVSLDSAGICKPFPTATSVYWKGKIGKAGYVLCLAPLK